MDRFNSVELYTGRPYVLGIVIGLIVDGLRGYEIAHHIGLGALVDGYTACHT